MPDAFDRSTARLLTWRYCLALGAVAVLTLLAQAVIQLALHRGAHDATVVNLAGRQRMLSQRLCKAALAWRQADAAQRPRHSVELDSVLTEWTAAHRRLSADDQVAGMGTDNSPQVAAALARLTPQVADMATAALAVLSGDPSSVEGLLAREAIFLAGMEDVVDLYTQESAERVRTLITLELGLCLVVLAVLVAEAVLVFRPTVARLRHAIADRERLREQDAMNRELTAASHMARAIGQDLHDGLGQTLTAISLQAKLLEGQGDVALRQRAAALGANIAAAIGQVRAIARRLAPVDVEAAGLEAALRQLADATARAADITCTVNWPAGLNFPTLAGEDLYRIAQEALTNALRHGLATTVTFTASAPSCLTITDNGTATSAGPEGIGLRSMRHRAQRLRATLSTGPLPQGGWRVSIQLPPGPSHP